MDSPSHNAWPDGPHLTAPLFGEGVIMVTKSGAIDPFIMEGLANRNHLEPSKLKLHHRLFSAFGSCEELVEFSQDLLKMLPLLASESHRSVEYVEQSLELYRRWYLYGERSEGLNEDILNCMRQFTERCEDNKPPFAQGRFVNVQHTLAGGELLWQFRYGNICAFMKHASVQTRVNFLSDEAADFLAVSAVPSDFVFYPQAQRAYPLRLNILEIDQIVRNTQMLAGALLSMADDRQEQEWDVRLSLVATELEADRSAIALRSHNQGAEDAAERLQEAIVNINNMSEAFMDFTVDWITAVYRYFKQPSN